MLRPRSNCPGKVDSFCQDQLHTMGCTQKIGPRLKPVSDLDGKWMYSADKQKFEFHRQDVFS